MAGFELCRKLATLEEYEQVLASRDAMERDLRRAGVAGVDMEKWQAVRYCTLQVEFVYERLRAATAKPGTMVSARAMLDVAEVLKSADSAVLVPSKSPKTQ